MDSPDKGDWIGLFPKGAKDGARTIFQTTGGAESGKLSFVIPSVSVPGEYEFRLYAHDSWQLVAISESFRIGLRPGGK
jgi:hypothetical protein